MTTFESFERAFRGGVSGCRRTCECGITYWDAHNSGYDWEAGELDELARLEKAGQAKPLDYAVGVVEFEGRHYVDGCACWHERARRIIGFLERHAAAIADFLRLEKRRKMLEAAAAPTVDGDA